MNPYSLENIHLLSERPIGVFDSGVGGLTVLRELQKALPQESFVYLGDTARIPYGSRGVDTVIRYTLECAEFLLAQEIKLFVVACNTASALAFPMLGEESYCPLIGTIDPAVALALEVTQNEKIGVIGTRATINSGAYQRRLQEIHPRAQVLSVACPLFVPIVEQGLVEGEIPDLIIDHHLKELREKKVDTVVLGCTHYPLLRRSLQKYFGSEVKLIECSRAIARDVQALLKAGDALSKTKEKTDQYYVTDEVARFNRLAKLFLGQNNIEAEHIVSLSSVPQSVTSAIVSV